MTLHTHTHMHTHTRARARTLYTQKSVKIMAKDLVRIRKNQSKFTELVANLRAISLQMTVCVTCTDTVLASDSSEPQSAHSFTCPHPRRRSRPQSMASQVQMMESMKGITRVLQAGCFCVRARVTVDA